MIAIDTSAIMAILLREPEADRIIEAIGKASAILIGVPTLLELRLVAETKLPPRTTATILQEYRLEPFEPTPFDERHLDVAAGAFERFGKGRHAAKLNFGDCMAYAVATVAGCPLLFKGEDFARTDIRPAA